MTISRACVIQLALFIFIIVGIGNAKAQAISPKHLLSNLQNIKVEQHQSALVLTIDHPPRNAVSKATLLEIDTALDFAANNTMINSVVITGANGMFSSGAGAGSINTQLKGNETHAFVARDVYNRIERFPKVVIAAVSGISAGGGNELAMACDIRIAGASATFALPELEVGLIPGFGGMQRLQRHIGLGRAMDLMLTGRIIDSKEALSIGLVTSVVADNKLKQTSIAQALLLAKKLNPNALAQFKMRMATSASEPFSTALKNDQLTFDRIFYSNKGQAALKKYIEKKSREHVNN